MENKRKVCLLLLTRIPYPPVGGDKLKSHYLVKILKKKYNLNIVIITDEYVHNKEAHDFLKENSQQYKIFTFPKYRFYLNALSGIFSRKPIQVSYYYFRQVQKYITEQTKESDFIITNLIRTAEYVKDKKIPKFLDIVDSIGLNYLASMEKVDSIFWKYMYKIEAPRVLSYEEKCISEFNATFFVNKYESEYWKRIGNVVWIPNGVNPSLFSYDNQQNEKYSNAVVFFGKMDYQPNIDAVSWYMKNVHKLVDKKTHFYIVGTKPTKEIIEFGEEDNVTVTGFMEDPYELIKSSLLVIAPMQTGAGIQNKILESMALGKIVITSSLGAKPIIGAQDQRHLVIADTAEVFAAYITKISENRESYQEIGKNAEVFIKENYTWDKYEEGINDLVEPVVSKG